VKFDKETIIAFVVCVGILLGWTPFCRYMGWVEEDTAKTEKTAVSQQAEAIKPVSAVAKKTVDTQKADNVKAEAKQDAIKAVAVKTLPSQVIADKLMQVTFSPNLGVIESIKLEQYFNASKKENLTLDKGIKPGALSVYSSVNWTVAGIVDNSKTAADSYKLVRKIKTESGKTFLLTQNWKIADKYTTEYSVKIKNSGKKALELKDLTVISGGLPPLAQFTGDVVRNETHSVDYMTVDKKFYDISVDDDAKDFNAKPVQKLLWTGVSNKYFTEILLPSVPFDSLVQKRDKVIGETEKEYYIAAVGGSYSSIMIEPGKDFELKFKYYTGPKVISLLKAFDRSTAKIMHLAWGPLDWLAVIMLKALIFLKSICGSYGWSIVILTVIVRLLFWPITHKANSSMKRMQTLQPKIKEIREKYKDDPQLMNGKVMELYKAEKVNPLGGCLPILLQIPVFFALYATLDGAVELRQVPFLWAVDLARPDTIAHIFSLPINPLIIVMCGLMLVQQKLTPSAMDPMQQKMMLLMPVFMLVFLYSLPSGLTLYWTVSQIFSILQLLVQNKTNKKDVVPQKQKA
jgi:YidC/Oxa1 family membrane protein insertase